MFIVDGTFLSPALRRSAAAFAALNVRCRLAMNISLPWSENEFHGRTCELNSTFAEPDSPTKAANHAFVDLPRHPHVIEFVLADLRQPARLIQVENLAAFCGGSLA